MKQPYKFCIAMLLWLPGISMAAKEAAEDQRFSVVGRGVLRDTRTSLEWTQRDNGSDITWLGAKEYCETLNLSGGRWRVPKVSQLQEIYAGSGSNGYTKCGTGTCKVSSLFQLSGRYQWSSDGAEDDRRGYERAFLVSLDSADRDAVQTGRSDFIRVLCVRHP